MSVVLGVDVGGTFTDAVALDLVDLRLQVAKVPTSRDRASGVVEAINELEVENAAVQEFVHGTTISTNALLERTGARCALLTTRGFRDVLEVGRRTRPNVWGLTGEFEPLIPRELRFEIGERIDAAGAVIEAVNEEDVATALDAAEARGAEAIVVHFLHSYANPEHEERVGELVRERWSNANVTLGSRVLSEFREFERGSTAAVNGYVQPVMRRYLTRLGECLPNELEQRLLITQGNGGMMSAELASSRSVQTIVSGPAAGVLAAAEIARQAGLANVITCDMGGTSFDVAVIRGGEPSVTTETDIDYGIPVRVPLIDVHTIGSGGGSIASVSAGGLLKVGPASAGSFPGPICYGRGGTEPTVTDANLILGRFDPAQIPGGAGGIPESEVRRVFEQRIGDTLGLDAVEAAVATIDLVNDSLANAIRLVSLKKGDDPRDFSILPFGGAGGVHAIALAAELGIDSVLIPRYPGLTSALGCALANVKHDFVQTLNQPIDETSNRIDGVDEILARQHAAGVKLIEEEGVQIEELTRACELDVLYEGQTHVFRVPIDPTRCLVPREVLDDLAGRFRDRFDMDLSDHRCILVNVRTTVVGVRPRVDLRVLAPPASHLPAKPSSTRNLHVDGAWVASPVYRRSVLDPKSVIHGPAIIEQLDTTLVLPPNWSGVNDDFGNIVATRA